MDRELEVGVKKCLDCGGGLYLYGRTRREGEAIRRVKCSQCGAKFIQLTDPWAGRHN